MVRYTWFSFATSSLKKLGWTEKVQHQKQWKLRSALHALKNIYLDEMMGILLQIRGLKKLHFAATFSIFYTMCCGLGSIVSENAFFPFLVYALYTFAKPVRRSLFCNLPLSKEQRQNAGYHFISKNSCDCNCIVSKVLPKCRARQIQDLVKQ